MSAQIVRELRRKLTLDVGCKCAGCGLTSESLEFNFPKRSPEWLAEKLPPLEVCSMLRWEFQDGNLELLCFECRQILWARMELSDWNPKQLEFPKINQHTTRPHIGPAPKP